LARTKNIDPRIKDQVVLARGKRTGAEFARLLGVSSAAVSNWEHGENEPSTEILIKLAALCTGEIHAFFVNKAAEKSGLSGSIMLSDAAKRTMREASAKVFGKRRSFVSIKLSSGFAGAGPAYEHGDDLVEGEIMVPADLCPNAANTRCVRIRGTSMEPAMADGTIAAVDLSAREIARLKGRVVAARHAVEGIVVKRLVLVAKEWRLASDAPGHDPLRLQDGWQIIGKVVWWIQRAES